MPAYFCTATGARIAAPGVSKAVDPTNGQDEVIEAEDGSLRIGAAPDQGKKASPKTEKTNEPDKGAAPDQGKKG